MVSQANLESIVLQENLRSRFYFQSRISIPHKVLRQSLLAFLAAFVGLNLIWNTACSRYRPTRGALQHPLITRGQLLIEIKEQGIT